MRAELIRKTTEGYPGYESNNHPAVEMDYFTLGNTYEVIAVYQVKGGAYLLLVDDLGHLANRLAYCFKLDSPDIPEDWKINVLAEKMTTIIGPEFLLDYEDLAKLLEYDPEMMDKLKDWYMGEDIG